MLLHSREHPIVFTLHNIQGEPIMVLGSNSDHQVLHLTLTNRSDKPVKLPKGSSFQLLFASGVLTDTTSLKIEADPASRDWSAATGGELKVTKAADESVAPGAKVRFFIRQVKLDPTFPAHSTRVKLDYNIPGEGGTPQAGYLEQVVAVVHHLGKKHLPVHVAVVGSRIILSDGATTNGFILRISNTGREPLAFYNSSSFVFHFDVGAANEEWALATADQTSAIVVRLPDNTTAVVNKNVTPPVFTAQPFKNVGGQLAVGNWLDFAFSNIVTSHAPGETNLTISYEDIPGYWDSDIKVALHKAPLRFMGDRVDVKARTFFMSPASQPNIANDSGGSIQVGPGTLRLGHSTDGKGTPTAGWIQTHGAVPLLLNPAGNQVGIGSTSPNALLTVGPPLFGTALSATFVTNAGALGRAAGNSLALANVGFRTEGDKPNPGNNVSLGIHALRSSAGTDWKTSAIGLKFDVDNTSPVNNAQIWMTAAGNLGVGTADPEATLHVNGRIQDKAGEVMPAGAILLWSGAANKIPPGWVLCDGQEVEVDGVKRKVPDLRGKFICGSGGTVAVGATGGTQEIKIHESNLPPHAHPTSFHDPGHSHDMEFQMLGSGGGSGSGTSYYVSKSNWGTGSIKSRTENSRAGVQMTVLANISKNDSIDIRPPWYALCFIMKL